MSNKSAKLAKEIAFSKKIVAELAIPKPQEWKVIPVGESSVLTHKVSEMMSAEDYDKLLEVFALK
jgi:hypothetical protein